MFLSLDTLSNLVSFFPEDLKSWKDGIETIVVDEVHTIFCEMNFRNKYSVYSKLPSLGIPIVGLSGSVPLFSVNRLVTRLGWSVVKAGEPSDMKIIHGGDVVGAFPLGFKIAFSVHDDCVAEVISFVRRHLERGALIGSSEAVHVFVSTKKEGHSLLQLLSCDYPNQCRFVSSETDKDEVNQVAAEWGQSMFLVLISTSIALVGNENPKCRHLACAGYLFDMMSMVHFFGRLRPYMRKPSGEVLVCVPSELSTFRQADDKRRWTQLMNERLMRPFDYTNFQASMTSVGLHKWVKDSVAGTSGCALKKLSSVMGQIRNDNCGACNSCRSAPIRVIQVVAQNRMEENRGHGSACKRVLQQLAQRCLVCNDNNCAGMTLGSKKLDRQGKPITSCLGRTICFDCGVESHGTSTSDRKVKCVHKLLGIKNKACYRCYVKKGVPGASSHDLDNCPVKGRLRRVMGDFYLRHVRPDPQRQGESFDDFFDGIYTSDDNFCRFMAEIESRYNTQG